jgi:glycosyltransferase involved in cell wall biosynthesis
MDIGGIETFIMNVYRNIDRSKIQFDFLVSLEDTAAFDEEIKKLGGNIYYIPPRRKGIIKNRMALAKFFKEKGKNYIAIHQHASSLTSILPLIYAKKQGIKTRIIHSHSNSLKSPNKIHFFLHLINKLRLHSYANYFFACSDLAAVWFYGDKKQKVEIINNGIDTSLFKYGEDVRKRIRDTYSIQDKIVFGHIGSFLKVKNQKYIVDVFQSFLEINSNAVLWLIGSGAMLADIKDYVAELNISNKVVFWGIRQDTYELLQGIDIFVFPSIFEGLPLALVEAQTAGLKIFASQNISKQAILTNNVEMLDIYLPTKIWAEKINECVVYERKDYSHIIASKGFDVSTTILYLEKIYEK